MAKLLNEKGPLKEPVVQIFTRQLLDAVDFLHNNPTKPVIHKDIKGQISSWFHLSPVIVIN